MKDFGLGFRVAYDGSRYSGFQLQAHDHSIQAEIEKALKTFFRKKVRIQFSSRTDSGVHAYDQWIVIPKKFSLYDSLTLAEKQRCIHSINGLLPPDIRIWSLLKLSPHFNLKTSVEWKEYEYWVASGPVYDPLISSQAWWLRCDLDRKKMNQALKTLLGTHDFAGFMTGAARYKKSTVRNLFKAEIKEVKSEAVPTLRLLKFRFRGSGFLHHMVRHMVGAVIGYGRGRISNFDEILDSKIRRDGSVRAPAGALRLKQTHVSKKFYRTILTHHFSS